MAAPAALGSLDVSGHGSVAQLCGWAEGEWEVCPGGVVLGRQSDVIPAVVHGQAVVIKRVSPKHVAGQEEGDARDAFVRSAEREVRFFEELAALPCKELVGLFPACSKAFMDAAADEYVLVLEDLYAAGFDQAPGLSTRHMKDVLEALACFHVAFWGNDAALAAERGSFWPLFKRSPSETDPDKADETWVAMAEAFPELALDRTIGRRLAVAAVALDAQVAGTAVTRIHGDAKPPNMFYRPGGEGETDAVRQARPLSDRVRVIDVQWTGSGNPLSDVANMLTAGLIPQALPEFDELFAHYEHCLLARLPPGQQAEYTERIRPTWDVCWLDYSRVAMLKLMRGLCPKKIENMRGNVGASMLNRSTAQLDFMARRAAMLLSALGH